MNGKWWRRALLGILLFDLCLFAAGTGASSSGIRLAEGLTLQRIVQDVFDPSSVRTQTAEKLTITTTFLLTTITLL
jgi:hypothetical protein